MSSRPAPQLTLPFDRTVLERSAVLERAPQHAHAVPHPRLPGAPPITIVEHRAEPLVVRSPTGSVRVSYDHAQKLASELRSLVGNPIQLHVHDNRSTMVSFRRDEEMLHLRVHHMFLGAGPDVVRALADYARARSPKAGKVLDQYVRQNRAHIKPLDLERAKSRPLKTRGEVHDLAELYDALNRRYFAGEVQARIGWGRGSTDRRRRSIRMGAYYHDTQTILIHPALDRLEVPRYFVELVVYHEMLHQAVPQSRGDDGRRCIHSPEFRERERAFADFERARTWERKNLSLLLRPARPKAAK